MLILSPNGRDSNFKNDLYFELQKDAQLKQQANCKSEREHELEQLQSKLVVMQTQLETSTSTINNLTVDLDALSQKYKNLEDSNKSQVTDLTTATVKSKTHNDYILFFRQR